MEMATMAMGVPAFPRVSLLDATCCSLTTPTLASATHQGRCTDAVARPALRTARPRLCSSFINSVDLCGPNASVVFGEASSLYVRSTSSNPVSQGKRSLKVVGLFGLGVPELVVVAGVAVLLFGPKKLPEIGKSLGKTMKSFQQAADEFKTELKDETESSTPSAEIPPAESISEKENAEKKV